MSVREIWRYPVKSMGGERLESTVLQKGGIPYDRGWAIRDESDGTIQGAKRFGALMNCSARSLMDSRAAPVPQADITLPDGRSIRTDDTRVHQALSDVVGQTVSLWPLQPAENEAHYRAVQPSDLEAHLRQMFALEAGEPLPDFSAFPPEVLGELMVYATPRGTYFDAFPVHVLTGASLRFMQAQLPDSKIDVRRFRPNILVDDGSDTAELEEFGWTGKQVALGDASVVAVMRCPRCIMTTRAHEGQGTALPRDGAIMRTMVRLTGQTLGIYGTVAREGQIAVGQPVRVAA